MQRTTSQSTSSCAAPRRNHAPRRVPEPSTSHSNVSQNPTKAIAPTTATPRVARAPPPTTTSTADGSSCTTNATCPYTLIALIGRGSFGEVWKAEDVRTGDYVAIKIIDFEECGDEIEDIRKEIAMLSSLNSFYVTKYLGSIVVGTRLWILMELCEGGSCLDLLRAGTLSEPQIAVVMREMLYGLQYLHSMGKIHRDIKAANILVTKEGNVKLADFGVSAELTATIAKKNTFVGTPYWMAPEVILKGGYNSKADIWSLGITAWELCHGLPPHANLHSMRVIFIIPQQPAPRLGSEFSPEFQDFIRCCLEKRVKERRTASELLKHPFIVGAGSKSLLLEPIRRSWEYQQRKEKLKLTANPPAPTPNTAEQVTDEKHKQKQQQQQTSQSPLPQPKQKKQQEQADWQQQQQQQQQKDISKRQNGDVIYPKNPSGQHDKLQRQQQQSTQPQQQQQQQQLVDEKSGKHDVSLVSTDVEEQSQLSENKVDTEGREREQVDGWDFSTTGVSTQGRHASSGMPQSIIKSPRNGVGSGNEHGGNGNELGARKLGHGIAFEDEFNSHFDHLQPFEDRFRFSINTMDGVSQSASPFMHDGMSPEYYDDDIGARVLMIDDDAQGSFTTDSASQSVVEKSASSIEPPGHRPGVFDVVLPQISSPFEVPSQQLNGDDGKQQSNHAGFANALGRYRQPERQIRQDSPLGFRAPASPARRRRGFAEDDYFGDVAGIDSRDEIDVDDQPNCSRSTSVIGQHVSSSPSRIRKPTGRNITSSHRVPVTNSVVNKQQQVTNNATSTGGVRTPKRASSKTTNAIKSNVANDVRNNGKQATSSTNQQRNKPHPISTTIVDASVATANDLAIVSMDKDIVSRRRGSEHDPDMSSVVHSSTTIYREGSESDSDPTNGRVKILSIVQRELDRQLIGAPRTSGVQIGHKILATDGIKSKDGIQQPANSRQIYQQHQNQRQQQPQQPLKSVSSGPLPTPISGIGASFGSIEDGISRIPSKNIIGSGISQYGDGGDVGNSRDVDIREFAGNVVRALENSTTLKRQLRTLLDISTIHPQQNSTTSITNNGRNEVVRVSTLIDDGVAIRRDGGYQEKEVRIQQSSSGGGKDVGVEEKQYGEEEGRCGATTMSSVGNKSVEGEFQEEVSNGSTTATGGISLQKTGSQPYYSWAFTFDENFTQSVSHTPLAESLLSRWKVRCNSAY